MLALLTAGCAGDSDEAVAVPATATADASQTPAPDTETPAADTETPTADTETPTADTETPTPVATVETVETAVRGYDLQGHRGARGLRPENTLPAFEMALDLMVDTLEFDLHLSADDVVIVWHDPVISSDKCTIEGAPQPVRMQTADELTRIRCGLNPDPSRFPDQVDEPGAIAGDDYTLATLDDVFAFVASYADSAEKTEAQRSNAGAVRFNIETKRNPNDPSAIGDEFDGETIGVFESAVIDAITAAGVTDRVTVQSFDHRSLWAIAAADPAVPLAALTRLGDQVDFADLASRGAIIWSADYRGVTAATVQQAHDAGLLVVPWTVNDPMDMADLLALGADGIITDRPDLAPPLK